MTTAEVSDFPKKSSVIRQNRFRQRELPFFIGKRNSYPFRPKINTHITHEISVKLKTKNSKRKLQSMLFLLLWLYWKGAPNGKEPVLKTGARKGLRVRVSPLPQ